MKATTVGVNFESQRYYLLVVVAGPVWEVPDSAERAVAAVAVAVAAAAAAGDAAAAAAVPVTTKIAAML